MKKLWCRVGGDVKQGNVVSNKRLLYLAFVRSQLGYASEVWAPQSVSQVLRDVLHAIF